MFKKCSFKGKNHNILGIKSKCFENEFRLFQVITIKIF